MDLTPIHALGNTLFRTRLQTKNLPMALLNMVFVPFHCIVGPRDYKFENKKLDPLPPTQPFLSTTLKVAGCLLCLVGVSTAGIRRTLSKMMIYYISTIAVGILAQIMILFRSKVNLANGETSALFLIFKFNKAQLNLSSRLKNDTKFFQTLTSQLKASPQNALEWLKEQQKKGYSYPFYVANLIDQNSSKFPIDAKNIIAKHPDYLKAYNDFLASIDPEVHGDEFTTLLDEKDPQNSFNQLLSEFLILNNFQQSALQDSTKTT